MTVAFLTEASQITIPVRWLYPGTSKSSECTAAASSSACVRTDLSISTNYLTLLQSSGKPFIEFQDLRISSSSSRTAQTLFGTSVTGASFLSLVAESDRLQICQLTIDVADLFIVQKTFPLFLPKFGLSGWMQGRVLCPLQACCQCLRADRQDAALQLTLCKEVDFL